MSNSEDSVLGKFADCFANDAKLADYINNNVDKTIVHCMACDEPIYELIRPIFWNSETDERDFKSLEPDKYPDPAFFQYMNCPKCGKFFPDTNPLRIKTNKGMMPHEPN